MRPPGSFPQQQQIPASNMTNGQMNGGFPSQFPPQQMQQKVFDNNNSGMRLSKDYMMKKYQMVFWIV